MNYAKWQTNNAEETFSLNTHVIERCLPWLEWPSMVLVWRTVFYRACPHIIPGWGSDKDHRKSGYCPNLHTSPENNMWDSKMICEAWLTVILNLMSILFCKGPNLYEIKVKRWWRTSSFIIKLVISIYRNKIQWYGKSI